MKRDEGKRYLTQYSPSCDWRQHSQLKCVSERGTQMETDRVAECICAGVHVARESARQRESKTARERTDQVFFFSSCV